MVKLVLETRLPFVPRPVTYFQMGKSSSKADEVAQRQALLTEIKRGKSRPEICISFYFNRVFFQTPTGY